jgi:hypothetical protein
MLLLLRHFVALATLTIVFASAAETIYELAAKDAELTTMMSIVATSGIHAQRSGAARRTPFTVFAIADAGFANQGATQLAKWRTSKNDALRLLGRLAVAGQHEVIDIFCL